MGQAVGLGRNPAAHWDLTPTPVQSKDWELPVLFPRALLGASIVPFSTAGPVIPGQNSHWFGSVSWRAQCAWEQMETRIEQCLKEG